MNGKGSVPAEMVPRRRRIAGQPRPFEPRNIKSLNALGRKCNHFSTVSEVFSSVYATRALIFIPSEAGHPGLDVPFDSSPPFGCTEDRSKTDWSRTQADWDRWDLKMKVRPDGIC
jgi:hypothetical protein